MNFLNLCKRLRQEAGYSGSGPSTAIGQTGEAKRIVDWLNDAWMDLQSMRTDWRFMLEEFEVILNPGDSTVTLSADFKSMEEKSVVLKRADGSRSYPTYLTPENMRLLKRNNDDNPSYPFYYSVDEKGLMTVFPSCNEVVVIDGDYYVKPSPLVENTDIPRLPEEHHLALVWMGLMSAAGYDEAGNTWQRGSDRFGKMLDDLNTTQLPKIKRAEPLA